MMRSMFSAVSGLRNHQVRMDVIGNNIANVNTVGFKASRVTFQDQVYELIRGASAPSEQLGGANPQQAGLGMMVRSIDTLMTQGSIETTGKSTDFAIQGEGFFVLDSGQGKVFTRVGAFDVNLQKDLVDPSTGYYVLGWMENQGKIDTSLVPDRINIPIGQMMTAKATTAVTFTGNIDASVPTVDDPMTTEKENEVVRTMTVYDSQGVAHNLKITFTHTDAATRTWTYAVTTSEAGVVIGANGNGTLTFNADGSYSTGGGQGAEVAVTLPNGAAPLSIMLDFGQTSQFDADKSDVTAQYQDGFPMGVLENFFTGADGVITGTFTNGMSKVLGRLALGIFGNPAGLMKVGSTMYKQSNNSGELHYSSPATGASGSLVSGSLEMANVDLSREFTSMIITQRGFQANSRIISTSDEMLQELVNLKR